MTVDRVAFVPPQPAGWSCAVWARSGLLALRTAERAVMLMAETAMWLPDGHSFGLETHARCEVRVVYLAPGFAPERPSGPVVASGMLREIVERSVVAGYLEPRNAPDARLLAVAADELATLQPALEPFSLRLPHDARLRSAAERVLEMPEDVPRVAQLAKSAGMSARTFERRFFAETGDTPRAWLRRARLRAALFALASGASVTEAGLVCGYASLSAFISAYREVTGTTPARAAIPLRADRG